MGFGLGILLAFGAFLAWGIGDFLLQKSTRKVGDWETLFFVSFIGTIIISPFVFNKLNNISFQGSIILILISLFSVVAFLIDFEALKKGKLSIVEPIIALEVPTAAIFAFAFIGESLNLIQGFLIAAIISGIVLVVFKKYKFNKKLLMEKGTFLALGAALLMGITSFLIGYGSRITSPLTAIWFTCIVTAIVCGTYLTITNRIKKAFTDLRKNLPLILVQSFFDDGAWILFAFAMSLAPIAVVAAITEGYVALAAVLGLIIAGEKLVDHQKVGLVISVLCAIMLAALSG